MKTITYDKRQGESIIHYEISFEEEQIVSFCERLKKEAFYTKHYDYKTTSFYGPIDHPLKKIREENREYFPAYTISKYKRTVVMEPKIEIQKLLVPLYRHEYDVNYCPHLLALLNELLIGKAKLVDEIMHPNFLKEYVPIRSEIEDKEEQYQDLNFQIENIVDRKLQVLAELEELLLKVKRGEYEIPIRKYYEEARKQFFLPKTMKF